MSWHDTKYYPGFVRVREENPEHHKYIYIYIYIYILTVTKLNISSAGEQKAHNCKYSTSCRSKQASPRRSLLSDVVRFHNTRVTVI